MTICVPATKTKCIPICTGELFIGTIQDVLIEVNVYIKDLTTGRIEKIQAASDGTGTIVLDISGFEFSDNHAYEMWVTLEIANVEDKLSLTIGDTASTLVALCFLDIESSEGAYSFESQTLEEA